MILANGNYRLTLRDLKEPEGDITLKNQYRKKGKDKNALKSTKETPTVGQISSKTDSKPWLNRRPQQHRYFQLPFDEEIEESEKKKA